MTAFLVSAADLWRYTQVDWKKSMTALKTDVTTTVDAKNKAEKDRKAFESQLAVLESEKAALTKALEEAKAAKDEAVATASSLKSEQNRLIRVAKEEAEEKVAKAMSERDEAVLILDTERVTWAAREKELKEETAMEVVKYDKTFRTSALFMVKEKYPDLDFSDIKFSDMKGYDSADPYLFDPTGPVELSEEAAQSGEGIKMGGADVVVPELGENIENSIVIPSEM